MADETKPDVQVETPTESTPAPVVVEKTVPYEKYQELLDEMKKKTEKERKEKEEEARKKGEFEKLYNEVKPIADSAEQIKARLTELESEIKSDLLAKLPKDKQERYKELDSKTLKMIVSDFTNNNVSMSPGVGGQNAQPAIKSFDDMTPEEKTALYESNPVAYEKMLKEYFSKNNLG